MKALYNDRDYARKLIINHYNKPEYKKTLNENNDKMSNSGILTSCCADKITIFSKIINNQIEKMFFDGFGCAVSIAVTDLLIKHSITKNIQEVDNLLNLFKTMILKDPNILSGHELSIFKEIGRRKNKVNCSLLGVKGIKKLIKKT